MSFVYRRPILKHVNLPNRGRSNWAFQSVYNSWVMDSSKVSFSSEQAPSVVSEKSPIPSLWLDTSVGIKLVKIKRGEKLNDVEIERGQRLRKVIVDLVREGKLLCPMSDQEEEYEAQRLDSEIFAEFSRLSRGVRMNHRLLVQDAQIYRAMNAFHRGRKELLLPWRIYFHDDPFRTMREAMGRKYIVSVTTPAGSPIVEQRRQLKKDTFQYMEQLRRELSAKRQPYEAQLKHKLKAFGNGMARVLRDFWDRWHSRRPDFENMMAASGFLGYLRWWINLGGDPRALYEFMVSEYVMSLPIVRISSQLSADLVTGNQPILSGDWADVNLLSTAIPLSHFVLTDKKMENRIKRLAIDREWKTKVFSMSTVEDLISELVALQ